MIGQKFGKWTTLEEIKATDTKRKCYKCICECGAIQYIPTSTLNDGSSKQCAKCAHYKHGMANTNIYKIWAGLLSRCNNPKVRIYKYYGGRGIKVCDSWLKFENFYKDMGDRPLSLQLDRIDNNGNYSSDNCRWITAKENNSSNKGDLKDEMPGKTFGKWTVLNRIIHKPDHWYYICRCECGTEKIIAGGELRRGKTTQCKRCKDFEHSDIHTGWSDRKKNNGSSKEARNNSKTQ